MLNRIRLGLIALGLLLVPVLGYPQETDDLTDVQMTYQQTLQEAEKGDATAQTALGRMYFKGQGVDKDYRQAFLWYQKAAKAGNATAQYFLGEMYENGQGVRQDRRKAAHWYRKVIANSRSLVYKNAQDHLERLHRLGY